jgi:hypothetical protein
MIRKGSCSHYRQRLERLQRRADYLKSIIESGTRSESSLHHMRAELSALEWALEMLTPWFAKDEDATKGSGV